MGEDVFGDGLLVRQTLDQDNDLRLANGVHALSGHVPALPVDVCQKTPSFSEQICRQSAESGETSKTFK